MEKGKTDLQFQQFLDTFPASVHEFLKTIPQIGGVLAGVHCLAVMDILKISVDGSYAAFTSGSQTV